MEVYFIGIAILFCSAIFSLLIKNQNFKLKFISFCAFLGACFTTTSAIKTFMNGGINYTLHLSSVFQNVTFAIDNLSAFFIVFISIVSTLGIIYSNGYLNNYIKNGKEVTAHCVFLPILMASMLGVVTCQNALVFLIIWELMSLSSFFLVIFENEKKEVLNSGIKYLVYMHVSVIFIILFFALLSINAGSLDFSTFAQSLVDNKDLASLIFIFGFIGFGIKAGFVPFHNWLPVAHPAAPSHVSGMMSGVMIKTGIYGILRALTFIGTPSLAISYFILILSVISALYGVLYAIAQHDIKKLLAYHSIENIGIIGIGIGVGMLGLAYNNSFVAVLGFAGAILHVLNHSIFKVLLFLAAGAVYNKTHTRNIEVLGGLIKSMPKTALLFLIGSIAICGLPPFNGFISEFLIYFGMVKGLSIDNFGAFMVCLIALSGLALVGTMAILCFTKVFSIIFLGEQRSKDIKVDSDVTISFIAPMSILAIFTLIIGLFPTEVFSIILLPVSNFVEIPDLSVLAPFISVLKVISLTSFAMLISILALFGIKQIRTKKDAKFVTWGCGYNRPNPNIQYSASSYASPFVNMMKPLFVKISDVKKPKTIFPTEAHYETHMEDIEESYIIKPIIRYIEKFFENFEKMQNGNIQYYIGFGLVFLLLALIGVIVLG